MKGSFYSEMLYSSLMMRISILSVEWSDGSSDASKFTKTSMYWEVQGNPNPSVALIGL